MTKQTTVLLVLLFGFVGPRSVAAQSHNVSLSWTASTSGAGNPSLTYNIYRSPGCSGSFALLNSSPIASTSFLDVAVPPGTYCYQATAILAGLESAPSNQATAVVLSPTVVNVLPTPQTGCSHRGPLIGWIRCIGSRPHAPKKR